jgi:O-antigen/teichoic acid export membrane protein
MITFLDIGIGNGLRNKFSQAIANNEIKLARSYVSTAYAIFGLLQLVLSLGFLFIIEYVPLQKIFNTNINESELKIVVLLTVVGILIKMTLDILSYVLFALQESSLVSFMLLFSNVLVILGTYALSKWTVSNLAYLSVLTSYSPIVILLICGFILYKTRLKKYRPSYQLIDRKYAKDLLQLGYKFFMIQLTVVVLFYTDNIIIAQLFGPSEVTTYNISFRYFNAANTIFGIIITPYWSAFTEAHVKNDNVWMIQTYNQLQRFWIGLTIFVCIMIFLASPAYSFWIGDRVTVLPLLNVCMGFFVIISCWNNVAVSVINGMGKVRFQLILSIVSALLNIPVAIFLGKYLKLGSAGVILATCFCLLIGSVFLSIQARKLIHGTASGIWND